MSKRVITVAVDASMQDAIGLLKEHKIRMYDIDRTRLPELKKKLKEKATMLYMVDHKENKREIY